MIGTRLDGEEIWLEPDEWARWVEDGRIPPHALIRTEQGPWVEAGTQIAYTRLRQTRTPPPPPGGPGVLSIIFPRRSLSATELLVFGNILSLSVHREAGYLE